MARDVVIEIRRAMWGKFRSMDKTRVVLEDIVTENVSARDAVAGKILIDCLAQAEVCLTNRNNRISEQSNDGLACIGVRERKLGIVRGQENHSSPGFRPQNP